MNLRFFSNRSGLDRKGIRFNTALCLFGLIVLLVSAFSVGTGMQASTKKKGQDGKIHIPSNTEPIEFNEEVKIVKSNFKDGKPRGESSPISPLAIPATTPPTSVTFVGVDFTENANITAVADVTGDQLPDSTATEQFSASDDIVNDVTTAMAFGKKSGNYYFGTVSTGGPNSTKGRVFIVGNPSGNYRGMTKGQFSTGDGAPVGLAVIDTPQGEAVIVLSVLYTGRTFLTSMSSADKVTITAYLPGASGVPDGTNTKVILPAGSTLGGTVIDRTFGGLAADEKGNIYAHVLTRRTQGQQLLLNGAILSFTDSDADAIPDKAAVYVTFSQTNLNPLTASSIVSLGGGRLAVYNIGLLQNQDTQIAIYTDANGDLMADGAPTIFATIPDQFLSYVSDLLFDDLAGTSLTLFSHMDFAGGQALITYLTANTAGQIIDSGVASIKDTGSGVGGTPMPVFQAPRSGNNFALLTFVFNVPTVADNVAPTVRVTAPNGGETVNGGTMLAINFTSSDNIGVTSHDISLSTDAGATFPLTVTTGLSGTVQTFNFLVPSTIDTTTARVRVTAKDNAGNSTSDTSDANFTIRRPAMADTTAPTVTISSPTAGQTLNAGTTIPINFTSTDNVAVASHNILFSADGTTFNTTVASGLPGNATTFQFRVPTTAATNAAIRVVALDAAGNMGAATVGTLTIRADTTRPTVTVTAPAAKAKLKGGQPFNVTFTSRDDTAVVSHEIQLSRDNGATFTSLATGIAGTATSAMVNIPNEKIKKAVIKVIARDAAGNAGEGVSGVFKVKRSN